jgi:NAD(P)-dependent dehydrogenase (short-subunit alcohol dehydrogenase family)
MKLKEKIAIVTGAGRGLGKGIAKALANEGAKVVVNERKETDAAGTVEMIKKAGGDATGIDADNSSRRDVQRMFAKEVEYYATVDILINNRAPTTSDASGIRKSAAVLRRAVPRRATVFRTPAEIAIDISKPASLFLASSGSVQDPGPGRHSARG